MGEFPFMIIIMAIKTGGKLKRCCLTRLVAFFAGGIFMFPLQRIPCSAVVEIGGAHRAPAVGGMAIPADRPEPSFVDILMAVGALGMGDCGIFCV